MQKKNNEILRDLCGMEKRVNRGLTTGQEQKETNTVAVIKNSGGYTVSRRG